MNQLPKPLTSVTAGTPSAISAAITKKLCPETLEQIKRDGLHPLQQKVLNLMTHLNDARWAKNENYLQELGVRIGEVRVAATFFKAVDVMELGCTKEELSPKEWTQDVFAQTMNHYARNAVHIMQGTFDLINTGRKPQLEVISEINETANKLGSVLMQVMRAEESSPLEPVLPSIPQFGYMLKLEKP